MRIKKLEIFGFKSFADRVVIDFDSGVTGIVGPNGCGKSNVVDALRWVMGEQSAKHLRGGNMQDVIFSGSQKRGPLGMAEVILTLENDEQQSVPDYAHFDEIEIARRLYKTGDSEYEINKRPCRLKDITELFLGTGVGTKAYSIIEQGRISSIVQSKPEERRQIIEEAAGITKYKARRLAAERKMESTEQNLLRINDIQREVETRLNSLEKQAQKAEKYHLLQAEIKAIETHHTALRYLELHNNMRFLSGTQAEHQSSAAVFDERINEYETLVQRLRDSLADEEKQLSLQQGLLYEAESAIALSRQDISFSTTNLEQKHKQTIYINEETRRLEEKAKQLKQNQEAQVEEKVQVDKEVIELSGDLELTSAKLSELNSERSAKLNSIEDSRKRFMAASSLAAKSQAEIASIKHRHGEALRKEKIFADEIKSKNETFTEKQSELSTAETELAQKKSEHLELASQLKVNQENQQELDNEIKLLQKEKQNFDHDYTAKDSRKTSLEEIEKNFDFASEGLARIMKANNTDAIIGLVAEFLEVPAELESLVEEVLKQRLETVIVAKNSDLKDLISTLSNSKEGRVRFYVDESLKNAPIFNSDSELSLPNNAYFLTSKLNILNHEPLITQILGNLVVFKNLDDATYFWPLARENRLTLVTEDNELLEIDGAITGGKKAESSGILKRKREIRSLNDELNTLLLERKSNEQALEESVSKRSALLQIIEETKSKSQIMAVDIARIEQTLSSKQNELRHISERIKNLEIEIENNNRILDTSTTSLQQLEETLDEAQNTNQELETIIFEHNLSLQKLETDVTSQSEIVTTLRVKCASLKEKQSHLDRQQVQNTEQLNDSLRQIQSLTKQLSQNSEDQSQLLIQKELAENKIASAQRERDSLSESLKQKRIQYDHHLSHVREKEATINAERKQLELVKNTLNNLMLKIQEANLAKIALSDRLSERYRMRPEEILCDYHLLPEPDYDVGKKLKELQKSIDYLGNINPNAMEEFAELNQRHLFLKTQNDDLREALEQLQAAIQKINETTIQRFSTAFNAINERFSQVFPRLFNGGKGWLELTIPQDLLNTGVEIFAQPPGKKLSSIALMSGGEKALTATSLIFAIFLIKPSPFCLLDEVDAPLDEANVERFGTMVKELSKVSQFIVITHNKRTMEVADQLYGITMEQAGISKTVHVKVGKRLADNIVQQAQTELELDPEQNPEAP